MDNNPSGHQHRFSEARIIIDCTLEPRARQLPHVRERRVSEQTKYILDETHIPKSWYNLIADLPKPLPPVLHPGTKQPVGPADLEPLFPMQLILQEVSAERTIDIPEPVRDVYRMWRPSPLMRARRLEQKLGTPAKKNVTVAVLFGPYVTLAVCH